MICGECGYNNHWTQIKCQKCKEPLHVNDCNVIVDIVKARDSCKCASINKDKYNKAQEKSDGEEN